MDELEAIFTDLFLFIDELIKDYEEPVSPSLEEIEKLKETIINNPANNYHHLQKHFYLIERVAGEFLFSYNVDKYLGLTGDFDQLGFHSYIGDGVSGWHYLKEYLTWGKVAYLFFREITKVDDITRFSFKTRIPMRFSDGRIYWVLQESWPLELDKNNNVISHINNYTISELYKEKTPIEINAEFYKDGRYCEEWNSLYTENRYAVKPFVLSPVQKDILNFFYNTPNATTAICAEGLKYPLNTVKKYISDCQRKRGVIDMAKASFPHIPIKTLKDVIIFLEKIGWFKNNQNGYKNGLQRV